MDDAVRAIGTLDARLAEMKDDYSSMCDIHNAEMRTLDAKAAACTPRGIEQVRPPPLASPLLLPVVSSFALSVPSCIFFSSTHLRRHVLQPLRVCLLQMQAAGTTAGALVCRRERAVGAEACLCPSGRCLCVFSAVV